MKIGILTYHRAHNYGAMLQAYALRTYLQAQGHEVEFIDYWPTGHAKEYNWLRSIKGHTQRERCVYLLYLVLTAIRRAFRIHKFEKFRELYLQLPSQPRYTQYGATINESYDLVIVVKLYRYLRYPLILFYLGILYHLCSLLHQNSNL